MVNQPTDRKPTDDIDVIFIQPGIDIVRRHRFQRDDAVLVQFMIDGEHFVCYLHRHRDMMSAYREWAQGAMTP